MTVAALWGCDPSPPRPERPTRRPGVIPRAAAVDGGTEGSPGPDAAVPEVIARCVARARGATPDALRNALAVLDEAALLDSACRLDLAPRLRAPDLCAGASLTSLREVCLTRAAMTAAAPDRCPWLGRSLRRDPVCVALAARDLGLCAAAGAVDRARCESLARDDGAACARLDPLLRGACEREVQALHGLLPRVRAVSDAASTPSTATLACGEDGAVTTLPDVQHGVLLDDGGALALLPARGRWPSTYSPGTDETVLALRVPTVGQRPGRPVRADAVLELRGLRALRTDDGSLEAWVTLRSVPRGRGQRAQWEARLQGVAAGVPVRCTLRVDAFVRDVVPAAAFVHHAADGPLDR